MPVYRLPDQHIFPHPHEAEPNGLLAVGGDLSPNRLLNAYAHGIFPWYSQGDPILWWSPDPRTVLYTAELHVGRSVAKRIRQRPYIITLDQAFDEVIERCQHVARPNQDGTWITEEMNQAYAHLHRLGFAHSCEAWLDGQLVGGLYGVCIGDFFAGESMFADAPDASKIAFVHFVRQLQSWGMPLIDCQMQTDHLTRFGARNIPRAHFLEALGDLIQQPARTSPWCFDPPDTP